MYLFLTAIQGMNAQNNDSSSKEILPSPPNVWQVPSVPAWEHTGMLDTIVHLFHKKASEAVPKQEDIVLKASSADVIPVETKPLSAPTTILLDPHTVPAKIITEEHADVLSGNKTMSISDRIAGLFHKKVSEENSWIVSWQVSEIIKPQWVSQISGQILEQPPIQDLETPSTDERFARLLAEDTVYHSMIRSQDVKNIRLQLSMRYMLLMLAIFVVIAWVVNNRVIMFWFYDFPILSRIRDALFGVLTGLFCLTIWFGSDAWLNHKISILILRGLALALFSVVLISIYLPFWR